ncbi:MAG: class I SAM-dependent methyltransferase, partial [Defluviitaleaceae bacterium]|nr:class I SAM-dependent methyltransferase [Defluviitaleaceae bacterium]
AGCRPYDIVFAGAVTCRLRTIRGTQMETYTLSPRLQAVMDFINCRASVLADIGTDHAYLPVAAVQHGLCDKAIACDLNPGPLAIADRNIQDAGLCGTIETRLGDGLLPLLPGEADCIVIAGMGGMRIWGIISEGIEQARKASRLILQPQHDTVLLRKNLHEAGFEIQDEIIVREVVGVREHFYVIIAACYTGDVYNWTEKEYFLGKFLIEKSGDDFFAYLASESKKITAYIAQIKDEAALSDAKMRLEWLKK